MLLSLRRVPCTLHTSVTHIKRASPTREAVALLHSALQPMLLSLHRVRCTLNKSIPYFERTSLTREAGAPPHSALQPNAAIAECHARHERDSYQVRRPRTRSR
jgi:hypothetical protein